jgi:protein-tyrosine phosphatase
MLFDFAFQKKKKNTLYEPLADIHCHILPGLDDGSSDMQTTLEMIDRAYDEGIRLIVFTPHVREPWMYLTEAEVQHTFSDVTKAALERRPDMEFYLGSEVYFTRTLYEEQRDRLRPMNGTDYVLTEFSTGSRYEELQYAIQCMVGDGYLPIIAHIERYGCLWEEPERIYQLKKMGAYLQVNANTITRQIDKNTKRMLESLLQDQVIDFIATDAHDLNARSPKMQEAFWQICNLCGQDYAIEICYEHTKKVIAGDLI